MKQIQIVLIPRLSEPKDGQVTGIVGVAEMTAGVSPEPIRAEAVSYTGPHDGWLASVIARITRLHFDEPENLILSFEIDHGQKDIIPGRFEIRNVYGFIAQRPYMREPGAENESNNDPYVQRYQAAKQAMNRIYGCRHDD